MPSLFFVMEGARCVMSLVVVAVFPPGCSADKRHSKKSCLKGDGWLFMEVLSVLESKTKWDVTEGLRAGIGGHDYSKR